MANAKTKKERKGRHLYEKQQQQHVFVAVVTLTAIIIEIDKEKSALTPTYKKKFRHKGHTHPRTKACKHRRPFFQEAKKKKVSDRSDVQRRAPPHPNPKGMRKSKRRHKDKCQKKKPHTPCTHDATTHRTRVLV